MPVVTKNLIFEADTANFLDQLDKQHAPPIHTLDPKAARKVLEDLQSQTIEKPQVLVEDIAIPFGPNGQISLRIVRPKNVEGELTPLIYLHGGGWILGSAQTHDRVVSEIASLTETAVVFVNYSPSPEAKFPTQIEQAYAATKFVAEQGRNLKLDPTHLALFGDSVGGNMAIGVSMLAKERKGPKINAQVLFYPVTSSELNSSSYQQFSEGPWLTKKSMEWFWQAYEPDPNNRKKPLISPLNASVDQLKGLPPTLVMTAEYDVLRDEGEAFAHKLIQAGVKACSMRVQGAIHDFVMLNPLAKNMSTKCALSFASLFLKRKLKK